MLGSSTMQWVASFLPAMPGFTAAMAMLPATAMLKMLCGCIPGCIA